MTKVRAHGFTISLDGFGAGPNQGLQNPLGEGGEELHGWLTKTKTFRSMQGDPGGTEDLDDQFAARMFDNAGAVIMGRNMFGPIRGDWGDDAWTGWWGENPPYHMPVFVLTHHKRDPIPMEGGTTFHFVTDGIESALEQATAAATGRDVHLAGGVSTIQQFLRARLLDELQFVISPVFLGDGQRLFADLGDALEHYEVDQMQSTASAIHIRLMRRD